METPRNETKEERAARIKAEFLAFKKPQTLAEDLAMRQHEALKSAAQAATGQAAVLTEVKSQENTLLEQPNKL